MMKTPNHREEIREKPVRKRRAALGGRKLANETIANSSHGPKTWQT